MNIESVNILTDVVRNIIKKIVDESRAGKIKRFHMAELAICLTTLTNMVRVEAGMVQLVKPNNADIIRADEQYDYRNVVS